MGSLTLDQKHNSDGFVKAGELIEIRNSAPLTLHDRWVLNILLENAGPSIGEEKDHSIPFNRLRSPRHKGGERVKDSILRLQTTLVGIPTKDRRGKPATTRIPLLSKTTLTDDEGNPLGEVIYSFSREMRDILRNSQYWGRIKAYVMFAFTSKYSLALYELLCLRGNLRKVEEIFTLEDMRHRLGVEEKKLMRTPDFLRRVIEPATTEINALSDFSVEIDPIREGGLSRGELKGFRVTWERKEGDQWSATLKELLRTKVGRRARIRGTVEDITF